MTTVCYDCYEEVTGRKAADNPTYYLQGKNIKIGTLECFKCHKKSGRFFKVALERKHECSQKR